MCQWGEATLLRRWQARSQHRSTRQHTASGEGPDPCTGVQILLANCLAHGRRQFVEVAANSPDECRYVLEMLGQVYGHDAEARETGLTRDERLRFHQERSGPVMDQLHGWLEAQFAERKTEPNSGLGKAITYLLRHWRPLTLFRELSAGVRDSS
jgi:transposase